MSSESSPITEPKYPTAILQKVLVANELLTYLFDNARLPLDIDARVRAYKMKQTKGLPTDRKLTTEELQRKRVLTNLKLGYDPAIVGLRREWKRVAEVLLVQRTICKCCGSTYDSPAASSTMIREEHPTLGSHLYPRPGDFCEILPRQITIHESVVCRCQACWSEKTSELVVLPK